MDALLKRLILSSKSCFCVLVNHSIQCAIENETRKHSKPKNKIIA